MTSFPGARLGRALSSGVIVALVVSMLALSAPTVAYAQNDVEPPIATPSATAKPQPPAEPPVNKALPSITGPTRVGATLTAKPGSWAGGPKLAYQWHANGARISGATSTTLTLGSAQKNKTITVVVTGAKKGYASVPATSKPTAKVGAGALRVSTPKISGKLAKGSKLTAKPGTWTKGTTFSYRWYAGGKAISKATKSTLTLTASQIGKRITVKITGAKADYSTVAKTSAASPKVAKAPRPLISGVKQKGKTLIVKPGTWTKGTKLSYQWLADGVAISKATASKLKLTKSLAKKTITVRVTGKKSGYATVSKTSAPLGRWPGRWIEIDLSTQRLYLHENGKVISTHLVSTGKKATPTEIGTFRVRAKVRIQNMGCSPRFDYCTKDVPWVMYFNGDQAVHGAYWHSSFGRVMSHGCVNLPVKTSKRVYEWSKVGTIVWVHE